MARVIKNIGYLALAQGANYVLPLVTIPYLTRVLGPERFGQTEYGTVALLYFSAVVIFGFQTTATRSVAQAQGDTERISALFSGVFWSRLVLFVLTTLVFYLLIRFVPGLARDEALFWAAYPILIGWLFYPEFLFQGIQQLMPVALGNFALKLMAAVLIFLLIHEEGDYLRVLQINAGVQIVIGLALFGLSFKAVPGLALLKPNWLEIKRLISDSTQVFMAHFFTRVYTFSLVLVLGLWVADAELGYYAAGFKLIMVAQSLLFLPLTGALFPYLTAALAQGKEAYLQKFRYAFLRTAGLGALASVFTLLTAPFWVKLVFGPGFLEATPYLQIMAPMLFLAAIHHFALQQGLLVLERDGWYLALVIAAGVLTLGLARIFVPEYGGIGAAWVRLLVEGFLAVAGWLVFKMALSRHQKGA